MTPPADTRRRLQWWIHRVERQVLVRAHPLRYLFLELTRRCNLACAYCGSSCTPRPQRDELSASEWVEAVRQIAADFDPEDVMIAVTGGEPLLKEGVFDLFEELARLGFQYGMVSNGQLLDGAAARRLVAARIGTITFSLDGPAELNDRLRGRGCTRGVLDALANLRAAGFAGKLEVMSTVTRPAVSLLDETRRFVAELGVRRWRVVPVMPIGRAAARSDLALGPVELRAVLEYVSRARLDGLAPVPELCEEGYVGDEFEGLVRPYLSNCLSGITIAGIRCDGRIGACPELGDAFVQGDLRAERLRTVWETRFQVFRDRSWMKKGACAECGQFERCNGGALHLYPRPGAEPLRCFHLMNEAARAADGATPRRPSRSAHPSGLRVPRDRA